MRFNFYCAPRPPSDFISQQKRKKKKIKVNKYLLALDIGNTNIVVGVYHRKDLVANFRLTTSLSRTEDEWGILFKNLLEHNKILPANINAIIICSVVPPIMRNINSVCKKYFNVSPMIVGETMKTKIKILYDKPEEVGQDRIVNAISAYRLYPAPIIIVDFGTATTFDVVSEKGEYLGGAISLGILSSVEALFEKTAKLPRIDLKVPQKVIGKNTQESMQAGIIFGAVGKVEGIISRIKKEMKMDIYVVATGGLSEVIAPLTPLIHTTNYFLTLEGLRIIYEEEKKLRRNNYGDRTLTAYRGK